MGKIKKNYLFLLIIIILHLFLLSRIIFFPYPELFIYSYLTEEGLLPYKQIFDQHFPGLMFFSINLFSLGIDTVLEFRILHLFLVVLTHTILFLTTIKLTKSQKLALSGNILYLIWQPYYEGYVLWIESFVTPLILLGLYFLLKDRKNFFVSGLLLGISLLFKQVVGPLIFFVFLYVLLKHREKVWSYIIGVSIPVVLLMLFVFSKNIWQEFIYWTVTFNLTTFADMGTKSASLKNLIQIASVFGSSTLISVYLLKYKASDKIILLSIFFIGTLFFALARFDFIHLQPGLAFSILLIIYLFSRKGLEMIKAAILAVLILSTILFIPRFYSLNTGDKVLFFTDFERDLSNEVMQYTKDGDSVFAMGTTPHLYYLTNTRPPADLFVFQFPWFMVEAEDEILQGIKFDPPKVIVRDKHATTSNTNLVSYMENINNYVDSNYMIIKTINGTEIMLPR